jgi:hypothetical protein
MNPISSPQIRRSIRHWLLLGMMFAATAVAIVLIANQAARVRVGDGSEYYAMELAWSQTQKPFMTEKAWDAYAHEFSGRTILGLVPPSQLRNTFPALRLGVTADYNHFWLYSALAATAGRALEKMGISSEPHLDFLFLHAALCALLIVLCTHWQGRQGFVVALFLSICSPMLWYITKAHTEFFTFCLSTIAVAALMQKRWAFAASALAVTSTQNISFAIPAAFCGVFALASFIRGKKTNAQTVLDVVLLCVAAVVVLLHPLYYFFRYGVLTPELLAGGATLKYVDPLMPFNFVLDPDLGLLPNWAPGTAAAFCCAVILIRRRTAFRYDLFAFAVVYIFAALIAQGATTNINSGASVYVARYGLWYICLFYPLFVATLTVIGDWSARTRAATYSGLATFILIVAIANGEEFAPNKYETYLTPSPTAYLIYRFTPWLYNPNTEIFSGRNAGIGDSTPPRPSIILGPYCRKALILTGTGDTPTILGHSLCGLSHSAVEHLALAAGGWNDKDWSYRYFTINSAQLLEGQSTVTRGEDVEFGNQSASGRELLISGWSQPEASGVWSDGDLARIRMKVNGGASLPLPATVSLTMSGFFSGEHRRIAITPMINGTRAPVFILDANMRMPATLALTLSAEAMRRQKEIVDIVLEIDQPRSPAELGVSPDGRRLGIRLTHMHID